MPCRSQEPIIPTARADSHPLTFRHQQRAGPLFLPDATSDSTARRRRKARQLGGDGQGIVCRLFALPGTLHHVVIPLSQDCGGVNFYLTAAPVARAMLHDLLGAAPRYVRVALSRAGRPHLHVLVNWPDAVPLPTACAVGSVHSTRVETATYLWTLAQYFARPRDERAARPRPKDCGRYTPNELAEQALDASELYLQAREIARAHGQRLPRLAWTTHLPFLKPDVEAAALLPVMPLWRVRVLLGTQRDTCAVLLAAVRTLLKRPASGLAAVPTRNGAPSPVAHCSRPSALARAPPVRRSTRPHAPPPLVRSQ